MPITMTTDLLEIANPCRVCGRDILYEFLKEKFYVDPLPRTESVVE